MTFTIRSLADKYNGIVYDILFIFYSWIYGLFFRRIIAGESASRFFERGDAGLNMKLFILLTAAAFSEIIGAFFIVKRIRHIRTYPGQYPGIVKNGGSPYHEGDSIIFFYFWIGVCRITLSSYIGYIAFSALGLGRLSMLGCVAFIAKDIIMIRVYNKSLDLPLEAKPRRATRYAANLFMAFSGMVFASAGFDAFMSRSCNVLCNFHHWTGMGNFILSLILNLLFFSILYIPTRTVYYIEELEFTDSMDDARRLRKMFFFTAFLSIIPWLF